MLKNDLARVLQHIDSDINPTGVLYWRDRAHASFDPLWQDGHMHRDVAYRWLAGQLGLSFKKCHIRYFHSSTCMRVVELADAKLKELRQCRPIERP